MDCHADGGAIGAVQAHIRAHHEWTARRIDSKMQHQLEHIMPVQGQATHEAADGRCALNNFLRFPLTLTAPPL